MSALTTPVDPVRVAALRRTRRQATVLLAVVAALFVVTLLLPESTAMGYVTAMLEAGLVGGLADWFAVVALFRHPLGLPIPHTAIIPERKAQFGETLTTFVRDQFLAEPNVRERLEDPTIPPRLGAWLCDPGNAGRLADGILGVATRVLDDLDDDRVVAVAHDLLVARLGSLPAARLGGEAMQKILDEGSHREVVTALIKGTWRVVEDNRDIIRARLFAEAPAWVPPAINDALFERGEEVIDKILRDMALNPDHELRVELDRRLRELAQNLQTDPELASAVSSRIATTADHDAVRGWIADAWSALRRTLGGATAVDHELRTRTVDAIRSFGARIRDDAELAATIQHWLGAQAPRIAAVGREQVGAIITTTVDRWEGQEAAAQLEGMLGPDLQFVRINGTLVGGLVGLVLHAVTTLL